MFYKNKFLYKKNYLQAPAYNILQVIFNLFIHQEGIKKDWTFEYSLEGLDKMWLGNGKEERIGLVG